MRRLLLLSGITAACLLAWSPQKTLAHGGLWGCRAYSSNYNHYYQQSYYPNYNNCAQTYRNNCSYYSNGYAPYSNYGSYMPYNNSGMSLGGNAPLGLLGYNNLTGTNLNGLISQPSYLSMPLSVGSGPSGYLQIPLGSPAGRASYIQIPVNSGYGPSSFLQIELGRNAGSTVPSAPAPSPTSNVPAFGAAPGVYTTTPDLFAFNISKTSSDDVPPVVPVADQRTKHELVAGLDISRSTSFSQPEKHSPAIPTTKTAKFQYVSVHNEQDETQIPVQVGGLPPAKSTSFSLVDPDAIDSMPTNVERVPPLVLEIDLLLQREDTPWVVK